MYNIYTGYTQCSVDGTVSQAVVSQVRLAMSALALPRLATPLGKYTIHQNIPPPDTNFRVSFFHTSGYHDADLKHDRMPS